MNDRFFFEVLEQFDEVFAGIAFFIVAGVFDAALFKYVAEGESRRHVVRDDFQNAAKRVVFERDVNEGVLLTRHVEQFCRVSDDLFFRFGEFQERTFAFKKNDRGVVAVDCRGFDKPRGQNCIVYFDWLAVVVIQLPAQVGGVKMNSSTHENFDAVDYGGELVFAGLCVGAAIDFAGEPAINNRRRGVPVAFRLLGNADGKNVAIEFGYRALYAVACGIENFVGGEDVAVVFEILFFDNAEDFAAEQSFGAAVRETEDEFHQFVVEFDADF